MPPTHPYASRGYTPVVFLTQSATESSMLNLNLGPWTTTSNFGNSSTPDKSV